MTDNGLAALAAALHAIHPGPRPWVGGLTDDEFAAAILGERGVFLPDGMPVPLGNLTEEEIVAAFKSGYLVPRPPAEQAATIATLRAAMDGLVEAWENAKRTKASAMHDVGGVIAVVDEILATAKETP